MVRVRLVATLLVVSLVGGSLALAAGGTELALSQVNGETVPWTTPKGRKVDVAQTLSGNTARRAFTDPEGRREVIYELSDDQRELGLTIVIHSEHFKSPMSYTIRYTKSSN